MSQWPVPPRTFAVFTRGRWVPLYDPTRDPVRAYARHHAATYRQLEVAVWVAAVLFLGTDVLTTIVGLSHPGIGEGVAMTRLALRFGWLGLVAKKCAVTGLIAGLWLVLPRPYRLAIPLTAVMAGAITVSNNVAVLIQHGILVGP